MIIFTNEGNPLALNLLICANISKTDVTITKTNLNELRNPKAPKYLPILQTDSGPTFFSTNAAARFLVGSKDDNAELSQCIEAITTQILPVLSSGGRAEAATKEALAAHWKKFEAMLKKSPFLVSNDKPTAADVLLWCLIAIPSCNDGIKEHPLLQQWYQRILALPEVTAAVSVMPSKSLTTAALQSSLFGGYVNVCTSPASPVHAPTDGQGATDVQVTPDELNDAIKHFIPLDSHPKKEPRVVLPKAGEKNILITSALPYVNNIPHLGNIIGCVLSADIFARYSRMCGYNTLFVCGTDEYGTATETKALAENMTPQEICSKYFQLHNDIYQWFGVGFDSFGRTSTSEQTEIVQSIFKEIYAAGFIETKVVEQLLCEKCNRFLADRFVEGTCPHVGCGYEDARGDQCDACGKLITATELIRPRCKVCNATPVVRDSNQLFLDLPKIEPKLRAWIETVDYKWTHNARVITKAWLKEGLRSRCITRDLKWGIPVPMAGFEEKVFYVWFDAPIGYMSITSRYTKEWRQWWQPTADVTVDLYQFMAKDNVPFHSVMFPSTLLALDQGYTLVSHIMATEYLNYEDGKFSKSRGIGVFGNDAQDTEIPADVWRFYLASARPEGQDSSFSWMDLVTRNNSELLNNLGNFVNRALVFCEKNFDGVIPESVMTDDDYNMIALVNREVRKYFVAMDRAQFRDAIKHTFAISRIGNHYIQTHQPWLLIKGNNSQKAQCGTIIAVTSNLAQLLAVLLSPFMPQTSRALAEQMNTNALHLTPERPYFHVYMSAGHKIGQPKPLFTKIETSRIDELKKKYGGQQQPSTATPKASVAKPAAEGPTPADATSVDGLTEEIAKQGELVRQLKATGEKAVWQPAVEKLLSLKKQLVALAGGPTVEAAPKKSGKQKKK